MCLMRHIDITEQMVNEYLTLNIPLTVLAKKYKLHPVTFSRKLKEKGIGVRKYFPQSIKYNCDQDYFSVIDTEEKAYWLGFIFADGWLCYEYDNRVKAKRLRFGIEISSIDKQHLMLFKKAIKSNAVVSSRVRPGKIKKIKVSCIRVGNQRFCNSLTKFFPPGKKSHLIRIPELKEELYRHFIRGYFDGDGSITKPNMVSLTSNSKQMLEDIEQRFTNENIGYVKLDHLYKYKAKNCWKLIKNGDEAGRICNYLYNNSSINLERKHKKYCQIFSPHEQ